MPVQVAASVNDEALQRDRAAVAGLERADMGAAADGYRYVSLHLRPVDARMNSQDVQNVN